MTRRICVVMSVFIFAFVLDGCGTKQNTQPADASSICASMDDQEKLANHKMGPNVKPKDAIAVLDSLTSISDQCAQATTGDQHWRALMDEADALAMDGESRRDLGKNDSAIYMFRRAQGILDTIPSDAPSDVTAEIPQMRSAISLDLSTSGPK